MILKIYVATKSVFNNMLVYLTMFERNKDYFL